MGRPTLNVGATIPMGWGPGLNKRKLSTSIHRSLLPDWMRQDRLPHIPTALTSCHDGLCPQTVSQKKPSSLPLLLSGILLQRQ